MFTKNIGIIFFILYLKATILEMSSQNNKSKIIDSVKYEDAKKCLEDFKCSEA